MSSRNSNASERSAQGSTSEPGRYVTRLRLGGYTADIVPDQNERASIHHCIVQHVGSPRVLYLGQEESFDAALECGHHLLGELARPHRERPKPIYEFSNDQALI